VRLERLGKLKNVNDLIESRTRDLPTCSAVPQPLRYYELLHALFISLCKAVHSQDDIAFQDINT
jgi:hypothetical protein